MSNLQFTSKLTEKAVAVQLQECMLVNGLFPELQSAYRQYHSTETALLKVKNDLLMAMDKGEVTLLGHACKTSGHAQGLYFQSGGCECELHDKNAIF